MAIFDRLDRMVSSTVDRVNKISFVLTPMVSSPNGRPTIDASRSVLNGQGIFDYGFAEHGVQLGVRRSYREANDLRALQTGREPTLSIDLRFFPTDADQPRQSDVITFPSNADLPTFDVMSVKRDGLSRLVLDLVHREPQS